MGWCKRRKPVSCTSSGRYGRCGARLSQPTRHEKGRGGGGAETGQMAVFDVPRGTGPYGIATTPMARSALLRLPAIISARPISIQTASQC